MSKLKGTGKSGGQSRRDEGKEREWREIIDGQRGSGESVRAFCRGRGVRESSFYRWRREIGLRDREAGSKQTSPVLAPVVFVDEPRGEFGESRDASTDRTAASIEIVFDGGMMVRVPPHSTREQLDMVLSVLEQTRC